MTVSNTTIKKISKDFLKKNLIGNVVASLIFIAALFICYNIFAIFYMIGFEYISLFIFGLLLVFLLAPLFMGLVRFFWRLSCGITDNPISVFYYFITKEFYFKTVKFTFLLAVRIAFTYIIFSIPVYALKLISGTWLYSVLDVSIPIWTVNLTDVINILKFIAVFATIFSVIKFYMAPMLFVADENIDIAEALHLSTVITKRTLIDFIFLIFNFLGWILASFFVVPMIYTVPFMILAYLVHCSYAVSSFNEEINKINHDDIPTFIAGV